MPRPSPRKGAVITSTSPRYSVSAMTIPAISAPSTAEKPIAEVTRLAMITTSRQADRNSSGLLVRAAWANRGGSSSRPRNSIATAVTPPIRIVPSSEPTPAPAACGAIAPSRNTIGTSARSSNNSIASAERPTGPWVPTSGITIAVEDKAKARPRAIAPVGPTPVRYSPPAMIAAALNSSAAPVPNTSRRMPHSRRNDSSRPIENSSRTMPSSANGSIACGFEIVT